MMFTLTVLPDGGLILTTEQQLTARMESGLRDAFDAWRTGPKGVALVLTETRVQHARSFEVDIPIPEVAVA